MSWLYQRSAQVVTSTRLAIRALKAWRVRQVIAAIVAALLVALVIGFATVLIPNDLFTRDIPPTWWDHPVWIITSVLSGILIATYVRPDTSAAPEATAARTSANAQYDSARQERSGKLGMLGGFLAWFAVGCPVCNKIALLILGYSGANVVCPISTRSGGQCDASDRCRSDLATQRKSGLLHAEAAR